MVDPECPRCREPVRPEHVKDFVEREGGVECWHNRCRYEHQQEARTNRVTALEDALRLVLPMAKGYAAEHRVGDNQGKVAHAERVLADPVN